MGVKLYVLCTVEPSEVSSVQNILTGVEGVVSCRPTSHLNEILCMIEGSTYEYISEQILSRIKAVKGIGSVSILRKIEDDSGTLRKRYIKSKEGIDFLKIVKSIFVFPVKVPVYILEWLLVSSKFLTNPTEASAEFPSEGKWGKPLLWILVYAAVANFINIEVFRHHHIFKEFLKGGEIKIFVFITLLSAVFVFIGAFLLDLIIGIFGKRPGYYKTLYFTAVRLPAMAILSPFLISSIVLFSFGSVWMSLNIIFCLLMLMPSPLSLLFILQFIVLFIDAVFKSGLPYMLLIVMANVVGVFLYLYLLSGFLVGAVSYTKKDSIRIVSTVVTLKILLLLYLMGSVFTGIAFLSVRGISL